MAKKSTANKKPADPLPSQSAAPPPAAPPPPALPADSPWITHRRTLTPGAPALDHLDQEWLLTNGTGAFAMGTLPAVNTRSYHGLLVAATRPPVGRVVILNQMLEQLALIGPPGGAAAGTSAGASKGPRAGAAFPGAGAGAGGEQVVDLTTLMFRDSAGREITSPQGHASLRRFEKGVCMAWHYTWGQVTVTRELYLHWQEQASTLCYRVRIPAMDTGPKSKDQSAAVLRLSPMVTLRDFHAVTHKSTAPPFRVEANPGRVVIRRGDLAATFSCAGAWAPRSEPWWFDAYYRAAAERGQECTEDYFVPGTFEVPLPGGDSAVTFTVALGERAPEPRAGVSAERISHLSAIASRLIAPATEVGPQARGGLTAPQAHTFAIASDDFIAARTVNRKALVTIIAGYPWFADWGRDTFIALPGLLLETGRFDEARRALLAFAESIRDGLVPNRFDDYDSEAAHYNTVDASLWYIRAAVEYLGASGDRGSWNEWLGESCRKIMDAYIRGTQFGIRMAGDGLITAGGPQTQLTWMDAACGGEVFTPRHGKAVEINALWFYALITMADLCATTHAPLGAHFRKLADRIRRSFVKVFWDDNLGYLRDHAWTDDQNQEHPDLTLRPNQILALSLPVSPLPRTKQVQVLDVVRRRLLTPCGLRTLPEDDPHYHPDFTGPQFQRDAAYHQGTIWPWLIGPYCEAVLRTGDFSQAARAEALGALTPLLDQLATRGLGQLHEICEAKHPHRPVGCMAQAWSVGEALRALRLIAT